MGYTGGYETAKNPDYHAVCSGTTNHAEALRIEFDPSIVKYDELVGACDSAEPIVSGRALAEVIVYRVLLSHA